MLDGWTIATASSLGHMSPDSLSLLRILPWLPLSSDGWPSLWPRGSCSPASLPRGVSEVGEAEAVNWKSQE